MFCTSLSHKETAKAFAKELFDFATKMREWEEAGEEPPADTKRQVFAFLNRFMNLDPAVMPYLIEEIRANKDVREAYLGEAEAV